MFRNRLPAPVKTAGKIFLRALAKQDQGYGGQRQSGQHSDKAHQLSERHQRKDNPKRRQADTVSYNFRRNEKTFEKLTDGKTAQTAKIPFHEPNWSKAATVASSNPVNAPK